jgi:hypothetical protein
VSNKALLSLLIMLSMLLTSMDLLAYQRQTVLGDVTEQNNKDFSQNTTNVPLLLNTSNYKVTLSDQIKYNCVNGISPDIINTTPSTGLTWDLSSTSTVNNYLFITYDPSTGTTNAYSTTIPPVYTSGLAPGVAPSTLFGTVTIDTVTMTAYKDGNPTCLVQVGAYAASPAAVFGDTYGGEITIQEAVPASGKIATFYHNINATSPSLLTAQLALINITPNLGYIAGDVVMNPTTCNSTFCWPFSIAAEFANVTVISSGAGSAIAIRPKTSGYITAATPADWNFLITVKRGWGS